RVLAGEAHRPPWTADSGRRAADPARWRDRRPGDAIRVGAVGEPPARRLGPVDAPGQRPHLVRLERVRPRGDGRLPDQPHASRPGHRLLELISRPTALSVCKRGPYLGFMPELPELEALRIRLAPRLEGKL